MVSRRAPGARGADGTPVSILVYWRLRCCLCCGCCWLVLLVVGCHFVAVACYCYHSLRGLVVLPPGRGPLYCSPRCWSPATSARNTYARLALEDAAGRWHGPRSAPSPPAHGAAGNAGNFSAAPPPTATSRRAPAVILTSLAAYELPVQCRGHDERGRPHCHWRP